MVCGSRRQYFVFAPHQVHHRPGCLSYGKSNGFPFYNDLQPAETILCFRAKYFGVCELNFRVGMGATTNLLTKIKCFLLTGEVVLHPILGALNKPSLRIVKKKYSSLPFAFTGILPLPGHSRFVKIYLIRQSLTAFCFSLRPPSSGYSCIRHYLQVPYGF